MKWMPWIGAAAGAGVVAITCACVVENVTPIAPVSGAPVRVVVPAEAGAVAASAAPVDAGARAPEAGKPAPVDVDAFVPSTWGGTPSSENAAPDESPGAAASATALTGADDFYACASDTDCVAVKKVGCCNHGDKEAVNARKAAAYEASFTCTERPVCAQFMRRDMRVPVCGIGHRCEMVRR